MVAENSRPVLWARAAGQTQDSPVRIRENVALREVEELSKVDSRDLVPVTLTAQLTCFTSRVGFLFWDTSWILSFPVSRVRCRMASPFAVDSTNVWLCQRC